MIDHRGDDRVLAEAGIVEARLVIGLLLLAQQVPRSDPELLDDALQRRGIRRILQVLDDLRLVAPRTEELQRLPGLPSARVVIDGEAHGRQPTLPALSRHRGDPREPGPSRRTSTAREHPRRLLRDPVARAEAAT